MRVVRVHQLVTLLPHTGVGERRLVGCPTIVADEPRRRLLGRLGGHVSVLGVGDHARDRRVGSNVVPRQVIPQTNQRFARPWRFNGQDNVTLE